MRSLKSNLEFENVLENNQNFNIDYNQLAKSSISNIIEQKYKNESEVATTKEIMDNLSITKKIIKNHLFPLVLNSLSKTEKEKKDYLKLLFKQYEKAQNYYDESSFETLSKYIDIKDIEKIILFLKYKKGLNYKEKIDMIKKRDIDLGSLLLIEKNMACLLKSLHYSLNDDESNGFYSKITGEKLSVDELSLFIEHVTIIINAINLIKCVVFNYYNCEIKSIDKNNKIKKVLIPNKNIFYAPGMCIVENVKKIKLDDILDLIKNNSEEDNSSDDFFIEMTMAIMTLILENTSRNEYTKYLLKDKYSEYISNEIENFSDLITTSIRRSILSRRKILLPKNGVILLVHNNLKIESILLKEIYNDELGLNNLIIITKYKDKTECINSITLKEDMSQYEWLAFGKCEKEIIGTLEYLVDFFELEVGYSKADVEYDVISPNYWKYRNKGYKTSNDEVNLKGIVVKREFEVEIAPFLRKINGEPSKESIKLAKRLGIILEEGYTIVKPHTRTYNKVSTSI